MHTQGSPKAPVTLLEYGDFECPYCGQAFSIIKDLQHYFGSSLRFEFRHYPVVSAHPHAEKAAEAAEAAGEQGKFWEMHDLLFQNQRALRADDLIRYAEMLDLDVAQFVEDLRTHLRGYPIRNEGWDTRYKLAP